MLVVFPDHTNLLCLGGAVGSKTLAWGFAMVPHQLHVLVTIFVLSNFDWLFYTGFTVPINGYHLF